MKTVDELASDLIQKLTDEVGVQFPLGQGRPFMDALTAAIQEARNEALEEAAQLAEHIDSGRYTATKTAVQAIRALKVG